MKRFLLLFLVFGSSLCASTPISWPTNDDSILPIHHYEEEPTDTLEHVLLFRLEVDPLNVISTLIFICAIIHTLFSRKILSISRQMEHMHQKRTEKTQQKHPEATFLTEIIHFFGEIEIIFGLWVIPLLIAISSFYDWNTAVDYLNSRNYTEAIVIVVILTLASTYPILHFAEKIIKTVAKIGKSTPAAWWFSLLTLGPLLGSFITEAGAMMVTGILLAKQFYSLKVSRNLAYATLGVLFTNVSLGGVLTVFASPPALLVADKWGWDSLYMFTHFGWKSALAIVISNTLYYLYFRKEFQELAQKAPETQVKVAEDKSPMKPPIWVTAVHIFFIVMVVTHLYDPVIFLGAFMFFLGFYRATQEYQRPLQLRPPLLVGFFFAAIEIHGGLQEWWIAPMLGRMDSCSMLALSAVLGPFVDNAALAYLATFIPNITEASKYAVVAGAISAGGLTVIANAPNPAGQQILNPYFAGGISQKSLFKGALLPTLIALLIFGLIWP